MATNFSRFKFGLPRRKNSLLSHPLHKAATDGELGELKAMVQKGLDPNMPDSAGWTPFLLAASAGRLAVCFYLLRDLGVKVSKEPQEWGTPIHLLVRFSSPFQKKKELSQQILELLVQRGIGVNATNQYNETALHVAAANSNEVAIDFLLEKGGNPRIKAHNGETAMHYALRAQNFTLGKLLLSHAKESSLDLDFLKDIPPDLQALPEIGEEERSPCSPGCPLSPAPGTASPFSPLCNPQSSPPDFSHPSLSPNREVQSSPLPPKIQGVPKSSVKKDLKKPRGVKSLPPHEVLSYRRRSVTAEKPESYTAQNPKILRTSMSKLKSLLQQDKGGGSSGGFTPQEITPSVLSTVSPPTRRKTPPFQMKEPLRSHTPKIDNLATSAPTYYLSPADSPGARTTPSQQIPSPSYPTSPSSSPSPVQVTPRNLSFGSQTRKSFRKRSVLGNMIFDPQASSSSTTEKGEKIERRGSKTLSSSGSGLMKMRMLAAKLNETEKEEEGKDNYGKKTKGKSKKREKITTVFDAYPETLSSSSPASHSAYSSSPQGSPGTLPLIYNPSCYGNGSNLGGEFSPTNSPQRFERNFTPVEYGVQRTRTSFKKGENRVVDHEVGIREIGVRGGGGGEEELSPGRILTFCENGSDQTCEQTASSSCSSPSIFFYDSRALSPPLVAFDVSSPSRMDGDEGEEGEIEGESGEKRARVIPPKKDFKRRSSRTFQKIHSFVSLRNEINFETRKKSGSVKSKYPSPIFFLTPFSGYCDVFRKKKWQRMYLTIKNTTLKGFSNLNDELLSLELVNFSVVALISEKEKPHIFELKLKQKQKKYLISTETREEKWGWVHYIRSLGEREREGREEKEREREGREDCLCCLRGVSLTKKEEIKRQILPLLSLLETTPLSLLRDPLFHLLIHPSNDVVRGLMAIQQDEEDDEIARALVLFFESLGETQTFLAPFIRQEIRSTKDKNTLFRESSLATRFISQYFLTVGSGYLKDLLSPIVSRIVSFRESLEVNPNRGEGVNFSANMETLLSLAQSLIDRVVDSVENMPQGLLSLFSLIYQETKEMFDGLEEVVLGSVFFLRYLCPAIVSPVEYGIIGEGRVTPNHLRALILISKNLQSLGNQVEFDGSKEAYMIPCNKFVKENLKIFKNILALFLEKEKEQKEKGERGEGEKEKEKEKEREREKEEKGFNDFVVVVHKFDSVLSSLLFLEEEQKIKVGVNEGEEREEEKKEENEEEQSKEEEGEKEEQNEEEENGETSKEESKGGK